MDIAADDDPFSAFVEVQSIEEQLNSYSDSAATAWTFGVGSNNSGTLDNVNQLIIIKQEAECDQSASGVVGRQEIGALNNLSDAQTIKVKAGVLDIKDIPEDTELDLLQATEISAISSINANNNNCRNNVQHPSDIGLLPIDLEPEILITVNTDDDILDELYGVDFTGNSISHHSESLLSNGEQAATEILRENESSYKPTDFDSETSEDRYVHTLEEVRDLTATQKSLCDNILVAESRQKDEKARADAVVRITNSSSGPSVAPLPSFRPAYKPYSYRKRGFNEKYVRPPRQKREVVSARYDDKSWLVSQFDESSTEEETDEPSVEKEKDSLLRTVESSEVCTKRVIPIQYVYKSYVYKHRILEDSVNRYEVKLIPRRKVSRPDKTPVDMAQRRIDKSWIWNQFNDTDTEDEQTNTAAKNCVKR